DSKVYPAPGNHEFQTLNAQGYRDYFGARAPGLWYSYDLGSWHIISLAGDEGIAAGAGSAQEQFLQADLAAHPSQCTLAYGHEHNYERFAPQTPAGVASSTGIQEIIVGTGGANEGVYPFGVPIANSVVRNQGT